MPPLPGERGSIDVQRVLAVAAGPARDVMITEWAGSVWRAWPPEQRSVIGKLAENALA
jgi:hypothetical protein